MPITFSLVATIAREADNTENNIRSPLAIVGNRVLFNVSRAAVGAAWEMWRSDDRGVSWTHHLISDFGGFKHSMSLNQGFWWMYDLNNTEFRRTSEANPGASGFASSAMNFTGGHDHFGVAVGAQNICKPQVGGMLVLGPVAIAGEPPATPTRGNLGDNTNSRGVVSVPDLSNDLLILQSNVKIRRVRVSPAFSIETDVTLAGTDGGAILPFPNVAAHTSSLFWASTDRDVEPSKAWRSINGGTSYTEINLATDFWSDVPGVTAERRKGHITSFARIFGEEYAFVRYIDAGGNPAQSGLHMKLAKLTGGILAVESNRIGDGNPPLFAGAALNAVGAADFYIVTVDVAGNTVRVYRATVEAPGEGFMTLRAPRVRPFYLRPGRI